MELKQLLNNRQVIEQNIAVCMRQELTSIKVDAENLVECAINMRGQGYSTFITAREDFLNRLETLACKFEKYSDINRDTR